MFLKSSRARIWLSLAKLGPWTPQMIYDFPFFSWCWECGLINFAFRLRGLTRWVGSISLKQQISSIKCAKQVPPKKQITQGCFWIFNHNTRAPTKKPLFISLWQVSLSQPCPWNRSAIPFLLLLSRCPRFSTESLVFRSPHQILKKMVRFSTLSLNFYLLLYIVFFSL